MKSPIRYLSATTALLLGMNVCFAQQQAAQEKVPEKPKEEKKPPTPEEKIVQTKHSIKIGGQEIKNNPTAGTLLLKPVNGRPQDTIFYLGATKSDGTDAS